MSANPAEERLDPRWVDSVINLPPLFTLLNQPANAQRRQMLGNRRLRYVEPLSEFGNTELLRGYALKSCQPCRISQRAEDLQRFVRERNI